MFMYCTESGKDRMNEELSDLMQRMSELKLLVPEGCISTQKIVGEGKFLLFYMGKMFPYSE